MGTEEIKGDAEIIRRQVAHFTRHPRWWRVRQDDLTQEGHLALLVARQTFDPDKGEWNGYAATAARLAMARFCWTFCVGVSGGMHRPHETRRNLRSYTLDAETYYADAATYPEVQYLQRARAQALRARVADIATQLGLPRKVSAAAQRVLLEEAKPAEVAGRLPVQAVYKAAARLRETVRGDWCVRRMLREVE
jgi:hypothetical protein